ncbi:MAG: V-type ATP synthase subunit D [bacterium]
MPNLRVNPTRMELLRLKKRAVLAQKGHKLLKEKRDGLMQEFLELVREVKELRENVDEKLANALHRFTLAQAAMDPQAVRMVSLLELQKVTAAVAEKNVMGVKIPDFETTYEESNEKYINWETSPELDIAMYDFREVLPLLLKLAAKEKAAELMAQEIEKTRRRVNALEHVLIPQQKQTIKYISMKLEEQGRAAIITTMKVKESISNQ